MKIIQHRHWQERIEYVRYYEYADSIGSGFSFPCDEQGNVDASKLHPCGRVSLAACLAGEIEVTRDVEWEVNRDPNTCEVDPFLPKAGTGRKVRVKLIDRGVQERDYSGMEPAIGKCECGAEVVLDRFTNTCECGADYNTAGQRLADRRFWGEETGESAADILAVDGMDTEACFAGDY